MTISDARTEMLARLLDGAPLANARMPWGAGAPGPIRWPNEPAEQLDLIRRHILGRPARVMFSPTDRAARAVAVDPLELGEYMPQHADGRCNALAVDIDAAESHGSRGLVDPLAAARAIGERAAHAGLDGGLLVTRSRSGRGYHLRIMLAEPAALADAALAIAYLGSNAIRAADRDAADYGCPHAFRCGDGRTARAGDAGAVELFPKSTERPPIGWALALPFGGGAQSLDVFDDPPTPIELHAVPACSPVAWRRLIEDARRELQKRRRRTATPRRSYGRRAHDSRRRLDPRTQSLLDGTTPQGERNRAAFCAFLDLRRSGAGDVEAAQLVTDGAKRCGLSDREIAATLRSARRRLERAR